MTYGLSPQGKRGGQQLAYGLLVWLAALGSLFAQSNVVSVPLEFKHGHLMAPAQVGTSNSVWMMLDTGFSITIIDPRLADLLELRRVGKTTIEGIAGAEKADLYEGPAFAFSGTSYTPRRVAALPSEAGGRSSRMEGVLGAGFFRRFVVEIDMHTRNLRLYEPKDFHYTGGGEILPIKIKNSTPVVEAAIKLSGGDVVNGLFEIDTGCDGGLCLGQDFVEAHNLLEASGRIEGGTRSGVGGDAETKVGYVPELQIGRMAVERPETNFFVRGSPVERGHAGHIGLGALRKFRIIFDYSRDQLILERTSQTAAGQAE